VSLLDGSLDLWVHPVELNYLTDCRLPQEHWQKFIFMRTVSLVRQLGYVSGERLSVSKVSVGRKWILPDRWEIMNIHFKLRLAMALVKRRAYIYRHLLFSGPDADGNEEMVCG